MSQIKKFRPKTFLRKLGIKNAELEGDILKTDALNGSIVATKVKEEK